MNKKIVIKYIGYILIFSVFIIGCVQFSWTANIDLSKENIDGVR